MARIDVYIDADWAGEATRHSQTSIALFVDGCPVYGASRRQAAIALSSGESEVYALSASISQALLWKELAAWLGFRPYVRAHIDSAAARGIAKREGVGKIKHLSTRVLWIQQKVKAKAVLV